MARRVDDNDIADLTSLPGGKASFAAAAFSPRENGPDSDGDDC